MFAFCDDKMDYAPTGGLKSVKDDFETIPYPGDSNYVYKLSLIQNSSGTNLAEGSSDYYLSHTLYKKTTDGSSIVVAGGDSLAYIPDTIKFGNTQVKYLEINGKPTYWAPTVTMRIDSYTETAFNSSSGLLTTITPFPSSLIGKVRIFGIGRSAYSGAKKEYTVSINDSKNITNELYTSGTICKTDTTVRLFCAFKLQFKGSDNAWHDLATLPRRYGTNKSGYGKGGYWYGYSGNGNGASSYSGEYPGTILKQISNDRSGSGGPTYTYNPIYHFLPF